MIIRPVVIFKIRLCPFSKQFIFLVEENFAKGLLEKRYKMR